MAYVKLRPRRSTSAEWRYANPILAEGEMAIELPVTGVGTGLVNVKFGDGVSRWSDTPYGITCANMDNAEIELSTRLSKIETTINDIAPKIAVSSPDITVTTLGGVIIDDDMIATLTDIKLLSARLDEIETEIESLQTILLLIDDAK